MQIVTHRPPTPTAIRTDLGAIFVSLELSRSTWLVTSLSPGGGEKMSKHTVRSGDVAGLLTRFSQLKDKVQVRMGRSYQSSQFKRLVWTVFGSTDCCRIKGSKATLLIPLQSRRRAGAAGED